jgi:nicotinamidase/pyrazinamidase
VFLVLGGPPEYCVRCTALDARSLGFATTLVEDGCRGVELRPGDVAAAVDELRHAGVTIARADRV